MSYSTTKTIWSRRPEAWTFIKEVPPDIASEVIHRDKTELPDTFVWWAPGVAIASDDLLEAAKDCVGSSRPRGWTESNPDVFRKTMGKDRILVRGCGPYWTVECEFDHLDKWENMAVAVYGLATMPLFTRSREAAMLLAEYFYLCFDRGTSPNLHWHVHPATYLKSNKPVRSDVAQVS
jgi:hypothetical protein